MTYKTHNIWIKCPNPIKGAKFDYFGVRSQHEWKKPDGTTFLDDAYDTHNYEYSEYGFKMVGDLTFSIYGLVTGRASDQALIGRYKSLEAALTTLRDMGVLHSNAMKTWLTHYNTCASETTRRSKTR